VTAIDTSVAVAALAAWHEHHDVARRAAVGASIPAHARLEVYSVLTRLPPPHRLDPEVAGEVIRRWFPPARTIVASKRLSSSIVERCLAAGIEGGAVYDALVGATASEAGDVLRTRDQRAAITYERLGIPFEMIG
jgi:predicted nucleic acid-binding protein